MLNLNNIENDIVKIIIHIKRSRTYGEANSFKILLKEFRETKRKLLADMYDFEEYERQHPTYFVY